MVYGSDAETKMRKAKLKNRGALPQKAAHG